jgi:hypothetical protein
LIEFGGRGLYPSKARGFIIRPPEVQIQQQYSCKFSGGYEFDGMAMIQMSSADGSRCKLSTFPRFKLIVDLEIDSKIYMFTCTDLYTGIYTNILRQ